MDTQQLTAARREMSELIGDATHLSVADAIGARIVSTFLEKLPALFAELEHLRVQADAHAADKAALTRTIRELRDQIVAERGISDERLLKIEKLSARPAVRGNTFGLFPSGGYGGKMVCGNCGGEYPNHNAGCSSL